jgi:uncharacterized protein (TIGR02001 family)
MQKTVAALALALGFAALPMRAQAEDASPLSFNIGAFTDYRYRGISQTRLQPALQGGADYASASGFYLGTWLSNIKWIKDAEHAAGTRSGGDVEWDLYGGYKGELAKDLGFDVGILRYQYPGNHLSDVPGAANANTTEIYGALSYGPGPLKYSHSVTNLFGFADSKQSGYLDLSATFDVMGFSITPHIGYQSVRHNSDFSYTDYALSASKDLAGLVVSAAIVGADTKSINGTKAYASPANGKDLGRTTLVVGIKKTF